MQDLDRESIIQASDFLSVISELDNTPTPTLDQVLEGSEHFRKYFSSTLFDEEINDFCLHYTKNYLFEAINREELTVKDVSIITMLEKSDDMRNKVLKLSRIWADKYPSDEISDF